MVFKAFDTKFLYHLLTLWMFKVKLNVCSSFRYFLRHKYSTHFWIWCQSWHFRLVFLFLREIIVSSLRHSKQISCVILRILFCDLTTNQNMTQQIIHYFSSELCKRVELALKSRDLMVNNIRENPSLWIFTSFHSSASFWVRKLITVWIKSLKNQRVYFGAKVQLTKKP